MSSRGKPWSALEVEAIVADYFHMLRMHLAGQQYNKSEHCRALLPRLDERTESSIEYKYRNVSAVLRDLNAPWIPGLQPLDHYQDLLFERVAEIVGHDKTFDSAALEAMEQSAVVPLATNYKELLVDPPKIKSVSDGTPIDHVRAARAIRRDYIALEASNRSLGRAGEEFVLDFEKFRLREFGKDRLSRKVEWVSETRGDGLGFDILSFNADGSERWIEVKTTSLGIEAPFYISKGELAVSGQEPDKYRLCRLFNFRRTPRMFELQGRINDRCVLDPISFKASF